MVYLFIFWARISPLSYTYESRNMGLKGDRVQQLVVPKLIMPKMILIWDKVSKFELSFSLLTNLTYILLFIKSIRNGPNILIQNNKS